MVYDRVIRCLGWKHDKAFYSANTQPLMQYTDKFPIMDAEYASVNVPGLHYAGNLAHGKDHLRSAGGFIHGFRYTARALFRMLESKRHLEGGWPSDARTRFNDMQTWDGGIGMQAAGCSSLFLLSLPVSFFLSLSSFLRIVAPSAHGSRSSVKTIGVCDLISFRRILVHGARG
jgi:hypothetical protein